jgi:hypothetical protein
VVKISRAAAAVAAVSVLALVGTLCAGGTAQAARKDPSVNVSMAGAPLPQNPSNPLAGGSWAVNTGYWDSLFPAYAAAAPGSTDQAYLAKSALQPRVLWFTIGNSSSRPTAISSYIAQAQQGDPDTLVQIALFGIWGFKGEGNRTKHKLTHHEKAAYRSWIDQASAQIGSSRVSIILEPDLALTVNKGKGKKSRTKGAPARRHLAAYAARVFHDRNPRAAVYLDAGDADWLSTGQAVTLLRQSGIANVRGFALGATHYSATQDDIDHGAAIVQGLAAAGIGGKHFVIDTADNGRPFTYSQFYRRHPHGFFDNSAPCKKPTATVCNALGVPPTWRVTSTALPLTATEQAEAAADVDGFLWFGRPWLKNQATPFQRHKAILSGEYSPF